jgi:TonB family protein
LPDGRVGKVEVAKSSGYKKLDRSAALSAAKWRFAFDGIKPLRNIWAKIPVRFQILPR